MLFNLPNLGLTPFFQQEGKDEERSNAEECSNYFNEQLAKTCKQLAEDYPIAL